MHGSKLSCYQILLTIELVPTVDTYLKLANSQYTSSMLLYFPTKKINVGTVMMVHQVVVLFKEII